MGDSRNLGVKIGANTESFVQGISTAKQALNAYNKALQDNKAQTKEVNSEIKSLEKEQAELKAEIAKSGEATDGQKQRMQELADKLSAARQKAAELATQQSELKSQIRATTSDLNENVQGLHDATSANVSLSDSMNQVGLAAKDFTGLVAKLTATVTAAVTALFAFEKESAQWADDINTLSKTTGIATSDLQKFAYATNLIDVSTSTLTGSLTKLVRNMQSAQSGTGSAYEAFVKLGVAFEDTTGSLRDRQDVFYELIDALGKIENETERDTIAMNLFGKSAQELNPLIEGGVETLKELGTAAEQAGLILSQEQLDNLNEFNDSVDLLTAKATQIKELAASEMRPALDGLVEVAGELLNDIQKMINSGELNKIAKELGETIKNVANILKSVIEFVWKFKEAIAAVVVAMVAFKISMSVGTLVMSLCNAIKALTTATEGAEVAQAGLNATMNANPYVLVVSAIMAVVTALGTLVAATITANNATVDYTKNCKYLTEELENLESKFDSTMQSAEAECETIRVLGDRYEELRKKARLTTSEKQELDNISSQLANNLKLEVEQLKDANGSYIELTDTIDNYISKKLKEAESNAYTNLITAAKEAQIEAQQYFDEAEQDMQDFKKAYEEYYGTLDGIENDKTYKAVNMTWSDAYLQLNHANTALAEYSQKYKELIATQQDVISSTSDLNIVRLTATEIAEQEAEANERISSTLDSVIKSQNLLSSAEEAVEKNTTISLNTLNSMCKQYPELIDLVNDYIAGVADEADVVTGLKKVYENDVIAYKNSIKSKITYSGDFYKNLLENNANYVNDCKSKYDIDVSNFANAEQAKLAIKQTAEAQKRAELIKTAWIEENSTTDLTAALSWDPLAAITGQVNMKADAKKNAEEAKRQQVFAVIDQAAKDAGNQAAAEFQALVDSYYNSTYAYAGTAISGNITNLGSSSSSSNSSADDKLKAYQNQLDLAYEAYNKLINDRIELIEAESDAAKKAADEKIAAIDKEIEARKRLNEDTDRQAEIDAINAQLEYAQLDELSRRELERKKQDLLDEQAEVDWERQMQDEKEAIQNGLSITQEKNDEAMEALKAASESAKNYFDKLAGTQTNSQIVNNNSDTRNIQIIQNALNDPQMVDKLLAAIYDK